MVSFAVVQWHTVTVTLRKDRRKHEKRSYCNGGLGIMGCCGGDVSGIKEWFRKLGIYGYLLVGFLVILVVYFIIVHQVHLAAYSSIIFIIVFIGLHLVMCGMGHGNHGGQSGGGCGGSHGEEQKKELGKEAGTGIPDGKNGEKKSGGCH